MATSNIKIVRYSEENQNPEALKGKWGISGETWGCVTIVKNIVIVVLYPGATVSDYNLPTVYDGAILCSDHSVVTVTDSTLTASLEPTVSGFGLFKLQKDN